MQPALKLISNSHFSDPPGSMGTAAKNGSGANYKPTVLVVDDDVTVRSPIAEFLRKNSYRVLEAASAEEAKSMLSSGEPIEVVFSAVNTPGGMNGFELGAWIARLYPDVHTLFASTEGDHLAKYSGYGRITGSVLRKPCIPEILLRHIKRLLLS